RMLFGQKRERFEADPNQLMLPFEMDEIQKEQQEKQIEEKITYTRKRPNHKGRAKLPEHLPVEEVEIHPEGDLSDMVCIGKEITEELEYQPAKFYIKRYIRHKYAHKNGQGVKIGELPERVIDKGIPSASVLSLLLTDKYLDHLPLYRQKQRFARDGIEIPSSTMEGWTRQALQKLEPLYESLVLDTRSQGYLQVDETTIKVLDKDKKGATHLGYYWVYHNPIDNTTLFDYKPSRAAKSAAHMLDGFKGYLQTDGYSAYQQYGKQKDVTHLACWAHARREFERALDNDRERAEHTLYLIQKLYALERYAKENGLTPKAIKELRLEESLSVINELGKWIAAEIKKVLPKSSIGKAMTYAISRWDALSAYLYDGILLIDNNPVENSIRPVALGRKNYLFAGSHDAAQRAAMIYSFFAICKKHEVNPFEWLKHTLQNINTINHKNIKELYPQNYKLLHQI
ncbi:MAG: IS66 family transposase, partial [Weeksellaceae bacterium]|nr:IS66 family transposase [Weeksellaceae bacterium]